MTCYSWMKLESVDFSCRHMFAVMKYANMKEILGGIIFRRWTIEAQQQIQLNEDNFAYEEQDDIYDASQQYQICWRKLREDFDHEYVDRASEHLMRTMPNSCVKGETAKVVINTYVYIA